MKLNYRFRKLKSVHQKIPIIMIHGLFGNLTSLGTLTSYLAQYYDVIQIDLRNHGNSCHDPVMTYDVMAKDVLNLLDYFLIKKCIVIGHSMGGKIAMILNILYAKRIFKIIVIDIAPMRYNMNKHNNILQAITDINNFGIKNKKDILHIMQKNHIKHKTILFLLKSFRQGSWNFNFDFIKKNYIHISNWTEYKPCHSSALFIKGALSAYITDENIQFIYKQFPQAYVITIPNTSHWVHYENPQYLSKIIHKFILD